MNEKQKLLDILMDTLPEHHPWDGVVGKLRDNLIANGVTVRERGRWIYTSTTPDADGNLQAHCSVCGAGETHAATMVGKVYFCWECGADMRGEENA